MVLIYWYLQLIATSLDMIKYKVEKTPYENLNYGIKLNKYKIRVPLFHALAKNEFKVADYLISQGADLDYVYEYSLGKMIFMDVLGYLRELKSVNGENLKYLEDHGFSISSSKKEEMIREANRDEHKEFIERLMKCIKK